MNSNEVEQRLCDLERTMENIQNQLRILEEKVEQADQVQVTPPPTDLAVTSLMNLEVFLVARFPQLSRQVKGSIFIPGVTGRGEMGPGNEPMPNIHSGNTHIDPRRRTEG